MKETFKRGDKVYYPDLSTTIHEVRIDYDDLLCILYEGDLKYFTNTCSVFKATKKNWKLLTKLYCKEFQRPVPKFKYIAMNVHGGWFKYTKQPELSRNYSVWCYDGIIEPLTEEDYPEFKGDWKDSCMKI